MKNFILDVLSLILTSLLYLLGGWDIALKFLVTVISLDYVTGVLSALYNKRLDSKIGLKGILKKFGYLCIVALSTIIDGIMGETGVIRTLVIYFFVANDGLSILENMGKMGVPLPKKLLDALNQLKDGNDDI